MLREKIENKVHIKLKKEHIKFIKDTLKKNNIIHMKQLHQLIINKYPTLKISR